MREIDPAVGSVVDVPALMILSATANKPKTVRDLAHELNYPIASLYRRVRALQTAGVLHAEKVKDPNSGKETMVYTSLIQKLQIKFGDADPLVELGFKDDAQAEEPTATTWQT